MTERPMMVRNCTSSVVFAQMLPGSFPLLHLRIKQLDFVFPVRLNLTRRRICSKQCLPPSANTMKKVAGRHTQDSWKSRLMEPSCSAKAAMASALACCGGWLLAAPSNTASSPALPTRMDGTGHGHGITTHEHIIRAHPCPLRSI